MARPARTPSARRRDREDRRRDAAPPPAAEAPGDAGAARWARPAVLAAVALALAALAWRTESSRDFGYHLATGRWILEHGAWPRVDPFTYTLSDRPYVDMHGLFQVVLALVHRAGGMVGVGLLRVAFALGTFAFAWRSARRRGVGSAALLGAGFGLAILTWEARLMTRPELASGLLLAAQLWLLRRHEDSGDRRALVATVPLQLVWVWSHALSTFGIAVLGLYAASSLVAGLRRGKVDPAPWLALAGATAVMFLNPYGAGGVSFLWGLHTRIQAGNAFADSISELASPFSDAAAAQFPALRAFKVMLVLTAAVVALRARRTSLFDLAVVAMFGVLAATRVRVVGLFAIAALPVALEAAAGLAGALPAALRARLARGATAAAVAVLAALAVLAQQTIAGGFYELNRYPVRFGFAESAAVFPVGTVATLEREGLRGRIFNAIESGGYLAMHRPEERTFIDGRLEVMGEEFYGDYLKALSGAGWDRVEARWAPTLALVPANRRELVARLRRDPAWALVDADGVAVLFARDGPDHRAAIAVSAARLRDLDEPAAVAAEAIAPPPRPSWLAETLGPRDVPFEAWGRGSSFLQLGMPEAARRELRRALLATDRPPPALVKTYVYAVAQLGRLDEARAWCRRLVELAPDDAGARELLARLDRS